MKSKWGQDISKNGYLLGITLLGTLAIFIFHYFYDNLVWTYIVAVGVYYTMLIMKSGVHKYVGEKAFKNNREVAVKAVMPWINGLIFAFGVDTVLYLMLSSTMQAYWMSNGWLGPLDVEIIEYVCAYVIVAVLLYVLQYSLIRNPDDDETKKPGAKREHARHEMQKERGVTIRG